MMSSKYKILITDYGWPSVEPERQVLSEIGAELVIAETRAEDELIALAPQVDGILTCWEQTTGNVIKAAEQCKIITRYGVGVDNIDVETATALGIIVTNVPAYCIDEVSDHAMALVLGCARKITTLDRHVKKRDWNRDVGPSMHRIRGQTLGLIGMGRIGRAVVHKAKAFGLEVIVSDPYISQDAAQAAGATLVDLPEVLAQSDFISIHTPLTPETEGLLGEETLRQMKPTAYVINVARGGLIDTVALHKALTEGWIAGAGLDVLPQEPPNPDDPLLDLANIILTPHAAFLSEESVYDLEVSAAKEVVRALTGQMPESVMNPEVLESPVLRAKELAQK